MSEKEKAQLVSEVNILKELNSPFIIRYLYIYIYIYMNTHNYLAMYNYNYNYTYIHELYSVVFIPSIIISKYKYMYICLYLIFDDMQISRSYRWEDQYTVVHNHGVLLWWRPGQADPKAPKGEDHHRRSLHLESVCTGSI